MVLNRNPVHAALSLVATLFGIAVLFVAQEAHFLAAVQVIVYAGAIVVLFLFVLMLLGVDRAEDLSIEPLAGQRVAAAVDRPRRVARAPAARRRVHRRARRPGRGRSPRCRSRDPERGATDQLDEGVADVDQIGESLFTDYLFAFEITSVLLAIAVVGAVVLASGRACGRDRRPARRADDGELRPREPAATLTTDPDDESAEAST